MAHEAPERESEVDQAKRQGRVLARALSPPPPLLASLWDEDELARQLRVVPRTVMRWIEERKAPPFVMVGKRRFYSPEIVREWLLAGGTRPRRTKRAAAA
jgi:Helix-turn-helix domain